MGSAGSRYQQTLRGCGASLHCPVAARSPAADVDNCAKAICDALNGIVYFDDSQIAELIVRRDVDPDRPRAEVVVMKARPSNARERDLLRSGPVSTDIMELRRKREQRK